MKYNLVHKNGVAPPPYECELVEYNPIASPYVLGALWLRSQKYWWLTADDQKYGRRLMAQIGSQVLMPCAQEVIDAIHNLYRLTSTIHYGTVYSYTGDGTPANPYVISPSIPVVPSPQEGEQPSVLFYLAKAERLLDNFVNGTTYPDAPDVRNVRQQLDDIKALLEAGQADEEELLPVLLDILAAIGAVV